MITRIGKPGWFEVFKMQIRAGLGVGLIIVIGAYFDNVVVIPDNQLKNLLTVFVIFFFFSIVVFNLVLSVQFWNRKDKYVLLGYYKIQLPLFERDKLERSLKSLGYASIGESQFQRSFIYTEGIGVEIKLNQTIDVDLEVKSDMLEVTFALHKMRDQMDGRQLCYKSAQEALAHLQGTRPAPID